MRSPAQSVIAVQTSSVPFVTAQHGGIATLGGEPVELIDELVVGGGTRPLDKLIGPHLL